MRPDWVIPAVSAFNLAERDGYRRGLRAGANLVTINLTPDAMRGDYIIYKRDRFIMTEERVLDAIAAEGLEPSPTGLADFYRREDSRRNRRPNKFRDGKLKFEVRVLFPVAQKIRTRNTASSSPARASSPRWAAAGK